MTDLRSYLDVLKTPASPEAVEPECPADAGIHTIKRGETLKGIARAYALTLKELLEANPTIDPYAYRAGSVLCIPQPASIECCDGRLYCARASDTLQGIGESFGVTQEALAKNNPSLGKGGVVAGQILCIPAKRLSQTCPGAVDQIVLTQGTGFYDILTAYNISYGALAAVNPGVDLGSLTAGQVLCVPATGARGEPLPCDWVYVIRQGDTAQSISKSLGITVGRLMMLNPAFLPGDFTPGITICTPPRGT